MAQYRVEYKAYDYLEIARGITAEEFVEAMNSAEKYKLTNLDPQSVELRNFYPTPQIKLKSQKISKLQQQTR